MIVDHERAWLALKKEVVSRQSHGKGQLLEAMAKIELECEIPEGTPRPAARPADQSDADGEGPTPLTDPEEDGYGNGSTADTTAAAQVPAGRNGTP